VQQHTEGMAGSITDIQNCFTAGKPSKFPIKVFLDGDSACITDTWTVSKQAEGSTFSLGLRDMTRRVRDCLGC